MFKNKMANVARNLLPKPIKQKLKALLGLPLTTINQDWRIVESIGPIDTPHVILDVGARNGWFFQCWKDWCSSATVYAFEPDKAAYDKLEQRYKADDNVVLSALGVGEQESKETFYHLSESEVSSSFLQHDQQIWDEIQFQTGAVNERQLDITTLDIYASEHQINDVHLIKMDIQGYELKALKGASSLLQRTSYVLVETAIQPLYKDAATFGQVHEFMQQNNFHLIDFRAWHRGNQKLLESDLLFRHNDLLPEIDENATRYYVGNSA